MLLLFYKIGHLDFIAGYLFNFIAMKLVLEAFNLFFIY